MIRETKTVEYRFVVPGEAVSFRVAKASDYKELVVQSARPVLPTTPTAQPVEIRLDYFHTIPRNPDMDNIAKCVIDALNGVAYTDDKLARLQSSADYDLTNRVDIQGAPIDLVKPLADHSDYLFVRIRIPSLSN